MNRARREDVSAELSAVNWRVVALIALTGLLALLSARSRAAVPAPTRATGGMVAAAAPEAVDAGVAMLAAGGNAVDAAVAVGFAIAVAEPHSSGLGGGGFLVFHDAATGRQYTLDYRETAPAAAHRDMYQRDGGVQPDLSRWGGDAVATPGLVAGLVEAQRRWGRLPLSQVVAPAVRLAREGVPLPRRTAETLVWVLPKMNAAARAIFARPDGTPLAEGDLLVQPDLAATLESIAADGGESFYRGALAERIVAGVRAEGGRLAASDLAGYRVVERPPVRGRFLGHEVVSMGPPSSGGVHLVQMLNILGRFPLGEWGAGGSRTWHVLIETMRAAYQDRARFLGDPDFVDVPVARLVSPEHAAAQANEIPFDRARPSLPSDAPAAPPDPGHTSHLSVIDGAGSAVAATHTINLSFGAAIVAPGTGVVLNDEMDDFSAAPGQPNAFGLVGGEANAIAPGKRPLSSMTPVLVLRDGQVVLAAGSPGGSTIITTSLQVVLNVLVHGMDVAQAVSAPRIHHQWLPDEIKYEPYGTSPDTVALLARLGHRLIATPGGWGNAMAVARDPASGRLTGAADPRGDGAARGLPQPAAPAAP
jgi:gamma-glutamyltranspeptidase/glutathione hydrolase